VTAINALGESAAGTTASAVPEVPPNAPSQLSATASTTNASVSLQWTASPGASSYVVKRALSASSPWVVIANDVSSTSFTDVDATSGRTYYYSVAAETSAGQESANSPAATATIIPAAPTNLTATTSKSQAMLSWTSSLGATSYKVLRSTTSGGSYSLVASGVTTTNFTDSRVTTGTTHHYVVQAVDATGTSADSSQVNVTPKRGK